MNYMIMCKHEYYGEKSECEVEPKIMAKIKNWDDFFYPNYLALNCIFQIEKFLGVFYYYYYC